MLARKDETFIFFMIVVKNSDMSAAIIMQLLSGSAMEIYQITKQLDLSVDI